MNEHEQKTILYQILAVCFGVYGHVTDGIMAIPSCLFSIMFAVIALRSCYLWIKTDNKERKVKMSKEFTEVQKKEILGQLKVEMENSLDVLDGIGRCTDRLKKLIKLDGPLIIIQNEVNMIQYRALDVLSSYEAYLLGKWATITDPDKDEPKKKDCSG